MPMITEGAVKLNLPKLQDIPTADMPVFYNPVMKTNRDISVELIKHYPFKKTPRIALPLAGSGIRALRIAKECKVYEVHANDLNPEAIKLMQKSAKQNDADITITNKDANIFLLESKGFDYIDIDPFGSPIPFVDAALKRIHKNGILAVTATDTAPLCGTYPKTCQRRYNANPNRGPMMHEIGLRILITKIQTLAAQSDQAAIPILSYFTDHYFRVFFQIKKSKETTNAILEQHQYVDIQNNKYNVGKGTTGKLFTGPIQSTLAKKLNIEKKFFQRLQSELDNFGFYLIPEIASELKLKSYPKPKVLIEHLNKKYQASPTHITAQGIKTTANYKQLCSILERVAYQ